MRSGWGAINDRGSSGTSSIFMIALVIILAASLGVFLYTQASVLQAPATATFELSQTGPATPAEDSATIKITYGGGNLETIEGSLVILVNGEPISQVPGVTLQGSGFNSYTQGATVTVVQTADDGLVAGDTITVVWRTTFLSTKFESLTVEGAKQGTVPRDKLPLPTSLA